jgi:hypothetical protein
LRLDSKTARRFAQGRLKVLEDDFDKALSDLLFQAIEGKTLRTTPKQKRIEESVRKLHHDSFIAGAWVSRTYLYFVFDLQKQGDGKPSQLSLSCWRFNSRSNAETFKVYAIITMHAMERLIERRSNPDVIKLAIEEFDLDFVNTVAFGKLLPQEEFVIGTVHGKACGIVNESGVHIVRTWIRIPGKSELSNH